MVLHHSHTAERRPRPVEQWCGKDKVIQICPDPDHNIRLSMPTCANSYMRSNCTFRTAECFASGLWRKECTRLRTPTTFHVCAPSVMFSFGGGAMSFNGSWTYTSYIRVLTRRCTFNVVGRLVGARQASYCNILYRKSVHRSAARCVAAHSVFSSWLNDECHKSSGALATRALLPRTVVSNTRTLY